ncbi:MAG: IS66 family insertion sequence element accessory protein TnpB [Deltaproteobacteria bacterium]|nr:IS66 family insertion sequence element accessory protein TnpB [Deltaproteobacteria bacterium]
MLLVPRSTKIYMGRSPVNIFIFFNRRRTMAKMIVWTRGGYTIVAKRLERGRFALPKAADAACVELDSHELVLLLEGIGLDRGRQSPRREPSQHRRHDAGLLQSVLRTSV